VRRRDFVQHLPVMGAGLAGGLATSSLTACAGAPYVVPRVTPAGLVVPSSVLDERGEAFLQAPGMERPVYLRRDASGRVSALLASCTHRGCQPEPLGDRLVCPCHGSEFSFDGSVLAGPAEEPLTSYEVSEADGMVIVRLVAGGS
jgi:Rieske Fe-S protein